MSVVVRMEMPTENTVCELNYYSSLYREWRCTITDKRCNHNKNGNFPSWCPIIFQLPEGHGRLVDKDEMLKKIENYHRYMTVGRESDPRCIIEDAPTIVPAERSQT